MAEPTLGGIPLLQQPDSPCSGASFALVRPATQSTAVGIGEWTVEIAEGRKIVVARGGSASAYLDAFQDGLRHAQQGLDLMSMQGRGNLSIRQSDDEHITWWPDVDGLVVRVTSISQLSMRDRKSTRLNSSHTDISRMPSSA